jgi:type II secretory pathway component PulF
MAKYRYETTDAEGNPVTGEVDGAGTEEARQKLADQGLDAERARLTEIAAPAARGLPLSAQEAAEVGSQIAQLTRAGMPLAGGLRATAEEMQQGWVARTLLTLFYPLGPILFLSEEMRRGRVASALKRLADQVEAGMSLEGALESQGGLFPAHIRGMILAGIKTGRLPDALAEFVAVEQRRAELRRKVWLAAAYPCVALGLVVALFLLFSFYFAPQFRRILFDFDADLPFATEALFWVSGPGLPVVIGVPALILAGIVWVRLVRGAAGLRRLLYAVPLIGPIWRWAGLCNLSRLMALLLDQQVPLPDALRLTAAGLREADLSDACRRAADRVESGYALSDCVRDFRQFPPSLRPLVDWSERTSKPAVAFRAGARMFETRTGVCITLLETILPPVVFLLILGAAFFVVWGVFGPLISLIQALSYSPSPSPPFEPSEVAPFLLALLGGLLAIMFGTAVLCVVRLVAAPRRLRGNEPELLVLVILGWVLLASGILAGLLVASLALMGPLGVAVALLIVLVAAMALLRRRRTHQYSLLTTMAAAAERLMPLAPAVEAFADERRGLMGYRARRLAELLRSGTNLPDALVSVPGLVSDQDQVSIRVGQESGMLAAALRDTVRAHELHTPLWNHTVGRALYLCALIDFACAVVGFMMVKIMPEMQKIFEEFDAHLPYLTQALVVVTHVFTAFGPITVPLFLLFNAVFALLTVQYVGGMRWSLPLLNRLTRRLDTAAVLESLALAAERNLSFSAAFETLTRWYPRGGIRRRLQAVGVGVKAGTEWIQGLAEQGLIRPVEVAVFQAAGRAGNLAWALREMADSNRRRLNYRLYNMVQVLFPLAIVAIGLVVMAYIVAYFLPLVSLIQNLS